MSNQVREIVVYHRSIKDPIHLGFDATHKMTVREAKRLNRLLRKSSDISHLDILAEVW